MARKKLKEIKPELDLTIYTKSGKLRKRKPKKQRNYFTEDTDNAIVEYLASDDPTTRNRIYNERMRYGFYKLAENIIHTFKFYYNELDNNVEDLKHEVVAFLLQKLHLYKKDSGKAYSYLGTIAKRYLINYNNSVYKRLKEKADLEEVDEDKGVFKNIMNEDAQSDTEYFISKFVEYVNINKNKLFSKDIDQRTISAI